MSIHPSLGSSGSTKKQRSVLKRTERLRTMLEKEQWKEGDKVYGLPKIKTIRIRIKKEKAAEKTEAEGATAE
ncbi:MAG: small basic protein, partial [Candidatus Omnitrophica bacterium]|nr:small basic protein [Candidatus Omnitrophota bacterium]